MKKLSISKEERKFLQEICPFEINRKSFRKEFLGCFAKELKTQRKILFCKSEERFISAKTLGNLFILTSVYRPDIIIFIVENVDCVIEQVFDWLRQITVEKVEFVPVRVPSECPTDIG